MSSSTIIAISLIVASIAVFIFVWNKHPANSEIDKESNLITDMILSGASKEEMDKAIKHSMAVIDAQKHQ